jgi:hypothetical protein
VNAASSGLDLPPQGAVIDDTTIDFAITIIERSGVAATAEEALRKPTGRPRSVRVLAVLVALLVLALDDRPLHLSAVTDLLYQRLSPRSRGRLGIRGTAGDRKSFLARYRCVRYCFHAICSQVDPSGLAKNRCVSDTELARRQTPKSPAETQAARDRLETLINALLEASASVLTDDERAASDGSVGLDATPVPLFSRGPSKRAGRCASDPDGGWYVREGDHRDAEDHNGRRRTRIAWALEATIATMATPPGAAATHPNLALGVALTRPGEDPGGTGARVLASIRRRGHRAGDLGADRAYTAALPERFHLPVTALGYSLVMDYRADQLGIQANSGGAILVEGTWSCPAMPEPLIAATAQRRAGTIDADTHATRIAARRPYHLKRKDGPDPDGYQRLACPATGHHPGLACPLRPASLSPRDGRTKVLDPPTDPPKLCRQSAITIAPDIGARHRQALAFGTDDWARRYATLRNTIEGLNGYIKDPAHEALAQPARRRVRGIAAQSIFCAVLLTAANLRKIRAHRAHIADNTVTQVAQRAKRRRVRLADHLPATG